MYNGSMRTVIEPGENILWEGRPNKTGYIFDRNFNFLLLISLVFIGSFARCQYGKPLIWQWTSNGVLVTDPIENLLWTIFAYIIGLLPVWIYIANVIKSFLEYKNVYYIVTDKKVYIFNGVFSQDYEVKEYRDMNYIKINRGLFSNMFNVGDVVIEREMYTGRKGGTYYRYTKISSIYEYNQVYRLIVDTKKANERAGQNEYNTYNY